MTTFYLALILGYILALVARITSGKSGKPSLFFTSILATMLALISGLRNGIGDTGMYCYLYGLIGPGYDPNGGYEEGFIFILRVLKSISENPQFMIFILGVITTVINVWIMREYSKCFELSILMYIASGFYLVTMNGIRQCLAGAFLFAATAFIIKGKFKSYLAVTLIMYTIHSSALVMIPIYFIARMEPWSKNIYRVLVLFLIGMIFYEPLMNIIGQISDKAATYVNDFNEGGANILRVAIYFVPVFFSYIKREDIKKILPNSNIFVNISLINLIIMVFSLYNWIFARFNIYTQAYTFILLPNIILKCLKGKERRGIYYGLLVCYFIFFIFEYQISMGIVYTSDFTIADFLYK